MKKKVQWALLLGCPVNKQDKMSTSQIKRCNLAIEAYKQGLYQNLCICGGESRPQRVESYIMRDYIEERIKVPIICEDRSRTTWQNFEYARKILGDVPILILTSSTHAFRSKQIAKHFFSEVYVKTCPEYRPRHIMRELASLNLYYTMELKKIFSRKNR